jgi:hypothetical protein
LALNTKKQPFRIQFGKNVRGGFLLFYHIAMLPYCQTQWRRGFAVFVEKFSLAKWQNGSFPPSKTAKLKLNFHENGQTQQG